MSPCSFQLTWENTTQRTKTGSNGRQGNVANANCKKFIWDHYCLSDHGGLRGNGGMWCPITDALEEWSRSRGWNPRWQCWEPCGHHPPKYSHSLAPGPPAPLGGRGQRRPHVGPPGVRPGPAATSPPACFPHFKEAARPLSEPPHRDSRPMLPTARRAATFGTTRRVTGQKKRPRLAQLAGRGAALTASSSFSGGSHPKAASSQRKQDVLAPVARVKGKAGRKRLFLHSASSLLEAAQRRPRRNASSAGFPLQVLGCLCAFVK